MPARARTHEDTLPREVIGGLSLLLSGLILLRGAVAPPGNRGQLHAEAQSSKYRNQPVSAWRSVKGEKGAASGEGLEEKQRQPALKESTMADKTKVNDHNMMEGSSDDTGRAGDLREGSHDFPLR